jgi:hypothetical protein
VKSICCTVSCLGLYWSKSTCRPIITIFRLQLYNDVCNRAVDSTGTGPGTDIGSGGKGRSNHRAARRSPNATTFNAVFVTFALHSSTGSVAPRKTAYSLPKSICFRIYPSIPTSSSSSRCLSTSEADTAKMGIHHPRSVFQLPTWSLRGSKFC